MGRAQTGARIFQERSSGCFLYDWIIGCAISLAGTEIFNAFFLKIFKMSVSEPLFDGKLYGCLSGSKGEDK